MDIDDTGVPSNSGFDPEFAAAPTGPGSIAPVGVQIVPCKNKIPRLKSWKEYQNALVPDAQFEALVRPQWRIPRQLSTWAC